MTLYKYCRRCGKRLEGEENRLRGYGKICYEKAKREAEGMNPLIIPTREQTARALERLRAKEQSARAEAEQAERARARLEARQARAQERRQQGARPPHLEETLTPTSKKPFLFTPPTLSHPC